MQLKGCEHGLWTQSNLEPDSNPETPWHLLRDFDAEVKTGGITTLKTDVAGLDLATPLVLMASRQLMTR